jgi:hypothetical protein
MATRASASRGRTESESTTRNTAGHQGTSTGSATRGDSEITRADLQDMIAEQRKLIQLLVEQQASTNARLDRAESNRPPTVLPVAPSPPQPASTKVFKTIDPTQFCGGAGDLDRFITQIKLLFRSHAQHFPCGDPDQVQYAMGLVGSWKENVDEGLRKT